MVAQHTFRRLGANRDPTDTDGTWTWLLDDPAANVATQVGDDGAVLGQAAFDPYGAPEAGGRSQTAGTGTSLGFHAALTDATTAKVMLGPRQYDPAPTRFTHPDRTWPGRRKCNSAPMRSPATATCSPLRTRWPTTPYCGLGSAS